MKRIIKVTGLSFLTLLLISGVYISYGIYVGNGYEKLQKAAQENNLAKVQSLLKWGVPASPNNTVVKFYYFSQLTDTPLHHAAKNGNYEIAKALIDKGATIDWCCCSCVTPLHRAIINKHVNVVKLLLDSGANTERHYDLTHSVTELAKLKSTPEIVSLINAHNTYEPSEVKRQ